MVSYVELTQKGRLPRLQPPRRMSGGDAMEIDAATRRNLELVRTMSGARDGSLLAVIDRTVTGSGGRLLAARLAAGLEGWPPRLAALTGLGGAELREVAALVGLVGQGGEDEGYVSIHASPTAAVL